MPWEKRKIKPSRDGLIVRDPITLKALDQDGELKPMNSYWLRRERDGSIVNVDEPAKPAKLKPKPMAESAPKPTTDKKLELKKNE